MRPSPTRDATPGNAPTETPANSTDCRRAVRLNTLERSKLLANLRDLNRTRTVRCAPRVTTIDKGGTGRRDCARSKEPRYASRPGVPPRRTGSIQQRRDRRVRAREPRPGTQPARWEPSSSSGGSGAAAGRTGLPRRSTASAARNASIVRAISRNAGSCATTSVRSASSAVCCVTTPESARAGPSAARGSRSDARCRSPSR
jgi:hypothetical protein